MFIQKNRAASRYLGNLEIGTDQNGRFTMTSLGANQSDYLYAPIGVTEPKLINVAADKTTSDAGTIEVVAGRTVAGVIVLRDGATIPPHRRLTYGVENTLDLKTLEIAEDHTFRFDGVPSAPARLSVRIPGLVVAGQLPGRPVSVIDVPAGTSITNLRVEMLHP